MNYPYPTFIGSPLLLFTPPSTITKRRKLLFPNPKSRIPNPESRIVALFTPPSTSRIPRFYCHIPAPDFGGGGGLLGRARLVRDPSLSESNRLHHRSG
jgi:hypothetical protein